MNFRIPKPLFEPINSIIWRDQFAHFVIGLLLTTIGSYFFHPILAVIFTLGIAVVREQIQHPLQCHDGCRTDLLFWLLGSSAVLLILAVGGK